MLTMVSNSLGTPQQFSQDRRYTFDDTELERRAIAHHTTDGEVSGAIRSPM
jgi:hypothetical protein